ncbi:hypothetical protein GCM10010329_05220 [Streptomyces spiroverticillatus]|uniref:Peptidase inhibitor family I36 protein n=1 Tax=Streptomyces finlayi TaxID=67296 RepID=A0A918WSU8_9ACTN|nr:hypothetical protein [Streptomyces finlayi]GGZ88081.1 hypothetical protein GCM10010329_05220 [Streptomyces spiroverticillatus]GHC79171.1 hypothetical protein GCM10010334_05200 [Streptomyces finlayi]
MHAPKRAVALATAALTLGGLFAAGATPAAAAPAKAAVKAPAAVSAVSAADVQAQARRCAWPRVCFYRGNTYKAAYKDLGYQRLGSRARSSNVIVNSRYDDGARIYLMRHNGTGKHWECAKPRRVYSLRPGWKPYAIDIRNSPSCR